MNLPKDSIWEIKSSQIIIEGADLVMQLRNSLVFFFLFFLKKKNKENCPYVDLHLHENVASCAFTLSKLLAFS
jgi:hypothetical protein